MSLNVRQEDRDVKSNTRKTDLFFILWKKQRKISLVISARFDREFSIFVKFFSKSLQNQKSLASLILESSRRRNVPPFTIGITALQFKLHLRFVFSSAELAVFI